MPLDDAQAVNALTVLTRLAQRDPHAVGWIRRAVLADAPRLIGPAVGVALETGSPMPEVLLSLVPEADLPVESLVRAYALIPPYTTALRALAAVIAERAVQGDAPDGTAGDARMRVEFAERLLETGEVDRATEAAARAVTAAREFAVLDPALMVHALRVLSAGQSAREDHPAAIATAERAITMLTLLGIESPETTASAWYTLAERRLMGGAARPALAAFDRVVSASSGYLAALRPDHTDGDADEQTPGRLWTPSGAPDGDADPSRAGHFRRILGLALLGRSQAHRATGEPAAALADSRSAADILGDLADELPDAYDGHYATALLELGRALGAAREAALAPDEEATALVAGNLFWVSLTLCREAAQRQQLDSLELYAALAVTGIRTVDAAVAATVSGAFTDQGLIWLHRGRLSESQVFITTAVDCARTIAERSPAVGRHPLQRALMARARWEEAAGEPDAARASAAESVAVAEPGDRLERAAAANSLSMRLDRSGRPVEAFEAAATAVAALRSTPGPPHDDILQPASAMVAQMLRLAEETGRIGAVDDEVLHYAVSVMAVFPGQRADDRILDHLALLAFVTITAFGRRGDSAAAGHGQRLLARLSETFAGHGGLRAARASVGLNVLNAAIRAGDIGLAVTAYEDVAAVAEAWPDDALARLEQAKCANALINIYIDTDMGRAAEMVRSAGPALRSAENLAYVLEESGDEADDYLSWLDLISQAVGEWRGWPADPAQLEVLATDYRSTVAARTAQLGPRHPVTLATRARLGEVLVAARSWPAAEAVLRELVDDCEQTVGAEHPDTVAARDSLRAVLSRTGRMPRWRRLLGGGARFRTR